MIKLPPVAVDFMNDDHAVAANMLSTIITNISEDECVVDLFEQFINHNVEHFAKEETEMDRFEFSARNIHRGEHRFALYRFNSVLAGLKAGGEEAEKAQQYIQHEILEWFIKHIEMLDTATAQYIQMGYNGEDLSTFTGLDDEEDEDDY